ncbi:helix-turn-helix domain-containing protein [Microbacterium aquilitoris]|uniref:helix-turn-helix domain-containing protein n=1 Tax=Microbacterium aquilitoris TaxID=3067307 RepID=UPI0035D751E2
MTWDDDRARRLGAAVRALRLRAGFSQQQLATLSGITKNQLQIIEAGRSSGAKDSTGPSNPGMATLTRLADVFGISVSGLLMAADL